MADNKKLERAKRNTSNVRAALLSTNEKGVNVEENRGAMINTPVELGKDIDIDERD